MPEFLSRTPRFLFRALLAACMIPPFAAYCQTAPGHYTLSARAFEDTPAARQVMDIRRPDHALLDAALFHATNEARGRQGRPPFAYSAALHASAAGHSEAMIGRNFYDHQDRTDRRRLHPHQRIALAGGRFRTSGENIAEYATIRTETEDYCPKKQRNGEYRYYECGTDTPCEPYTYIGFAREVVKGWMASPGHRSNILNKDFQYLGCAARLSPDPYRSRDLPFARLTQNFGGAGAAVRAATR